MIVGICEGWVLEDFDQSMSESNPVNDLQGIVSAIGTANKDVR